MTRVPTYRIIQYTRCNNVDICCCFIVVVVFKLLSTTNMCYSSIEYVPHSLSTEAIYEAKSLLCATSLHLVTNCFPLGVNITPFIQ